MDLKLSLRSIFLNKDQTHPYSYLIHYRICLVSRASQPILSLTVRGYDRRFKASKIDVSLSEILGRTSIYHIYREEATSVSLEFTFFKEKQVYFRDILKCGNIAGRDSVLKRIRKKLPKRMSKKWVKG